MEWMYWVVGGLSYVVVAFFAAREAESFSVGLTWPLCALAKFGKFIAKDLSTL